ncbi:MAG: T9SS type A sorting domain-containing protein [Bacteroidia bacterium]
MQKSSKISLLGVERLIKVLVVTAIILLIQLAFISSSNAQLYIDGTSLIVRKNAVLYVDGNLETTKSGSVDPRIGNWGTIDITGNTDLHTDTKYNGIGELQLTGTSKQTISSNSIPIKKLKIENNANVEIDADFELKGDLTLTDGFLILGNNDLTIGDSVDISGGSSSSYIRVNGTGKVRAKVGSDPVTLPIGRNPYLPIIIDDGGDREYTVGISENVYANPVTQSTQQTTNVVGETWSIQSSGSQSNVSVTLQWNASEEETGFARGTAWLGYWENGVSSSWNNGSSMSASGSGPYSLTRTINFSTNLFYFGVGSAGSALPVEFTYFDANWLSDGESAILEWQTSMEENNSHFEIERSFDGQAWEQVGTVQGQGNTFNITDYQFVDQLEAHNSKLATKLYYRLKQVDYNGDFDYSPIETLNFELETRNTFKVWPNPTNGDVIFTNIISDYEIYSLSGRLLKSFENCSQLKINDLEKGTYIIKSLNGQTTMFVKN